jgi:hypothetical protein
MVRMRTFCRHHKTAQRLMKITRHSILANGAHGHLLPPSWRTLYEMTKLDQRTEEIMVEKSEKKCRLISPR